MSRKIKRDSRCTCGNLARLRDDNSREAGRRDAINKARGFMRAPVAGIASRHGCGIRLIILIAPSTPFLYTRGKCLAFARLLARSLGCLLARALPSRALKFMPLAAICTYNQASERESSRRAIRACVYIYVRAATYEPVRINDHGVSIERSRYTRGARLYCAPRRGTTQRTFFREPRV